MNSYAELVSISDEEKPNDWDDNEHIAFKAKDVIFFADKQHWPLLSKGRLYFSKLTPRKYMRGYFSCGVKSSFHRFIMNAPDGYVVDHINRNACDNRSCNLRVVHYVQNNANSSRPNSKAVYRGVRKARNQWEASVTFNKSSQYVGLFKTPEEAAVAYDKRVVQCFGSACITNFPIENYEIPEECLADKLEPVFLNRKAPKKECESEGCSENSIGGKLLCRTHHYRHEAYLERRNRGCRVYLNKRVTEKLEKCILGCDRKVFSQNLCSPHYTEKRISQGYVKPPKKTYLCSHLDCTTKADKIKERLCRIHWNAKHGIVTKRTGRPPKAK